MRMKASSGKYTTQHCCKQLKKLRIYRGYNKQASLCQQLNISRQVWSLWEQGKRMPTLQHIVDIASFLKMDINYFLLPGAMPGEYDLEPPGKKPSGESRPLSSIPFALTRVAAQIMEILDWCREKKGNFVLNAFPDSGNTRALKEYLLKHPGSGEYIRGKLTFPEIRVPGMLIVDHGEKLPEEQLIGLLVSRKENFPGPLVLLGQNLDARIRNLGLEEQIEEIFLLDCITLEDFDLILRQALPGKDRALYKAFCLETGASLKKLEKYLRYLEELKDWEQEKDLSPGAFFSLAGRLFPGGVTYV